MYKYGEQRNAVNFLFSKIDETSSEITLSKC